MYPFFFNLLLGYCLEQTWCIMICLSRLSFHRVASSVRIPRQGHLWWVIKIWTWKCYEKKTPKNISFHRGTRPYSLMNVWVPCHRWNPEHFDCMCDSNMEMQSLCHTTAPRLWGKFLFFLSWWCMCYNWQDIILCVPEVYGPALSGDHVVSGAALATAVVYQW